MDVCVLMGADGCVRMAAEVVKVLDACVVRSFWMIVSQDEFCETTIGYRLFW